MRRRHLHLSSTFNVLFLISCLSASTLEENAQGGAALSLWNDVHMSRSPLWRKAQGGAALSLWSDVHMSDLGDRSCFV